MVQYPFTDNGIVNTIPSSMVISDTETTKKIAVVPLNSAGVSINFQLNNSLLIGIFIGLLLASILNIRFNI